MKLARLDKISEGREFSQQHYYLLAALLASEGQLEDSKRPLAFRRQAEFPTERRPEKRELFSDSIQVIETWFEQSAIWLGNNARTPQQRQQAQQLLYT